MSLPGPPHSRHDDRPPLTLGRAAPSWAFTAHPFPNGWALVCAVAGAIAFVFGLGPGALGLVAALPFLATALVARRLGRRRLAQLPWLGGRNLITAGTGLALVGFGLGLIDAL